MLTVVADLNTDTDPLAGFHRFGIPVKLNSLYTRNQ
jgi:hypothetical protein